MCGICGITYADKDRQVERGILTEMNTSLVHRGPDEEGYFIKGNVGLGMRRLSIIDVEGGHQPMYSEDKAVCVVCNGEIYNYKELRGELERRGHTLSTRSDTEVIVHLYEENPDNFIEKLWGMFAIALYDAKKDKLIVVRDRLGIKPLYYTQQNGAFLFSSELKAVMRYPSVRKEISLESISDYLTYLYIPAPETIFKNIYKLPPAHMLTVSRGEVLLRKYWEIDYHKGREEREEYYIERLEELLKESVRLHLASDVPLGAFLSGGVDSSSIVALMSRITENPVKTFSVGFDVADFNELKYARMVAKRLGTEHHEISLKPDIVNLLPKIVGRFDEPFADSSSIPTYLISEFARQKVIVCLSGDGGDELFAGYEWTRRQRFIDTYNRLPRILKDRLKSILIKDTYSPERKNTAIDKGRRFIYDANLSLERSFMRRKTCFSEEMKKSLFNEDVNRRTEGYESISKILPYLAESGIRDNLEKLLFVDTKSYLPDDGLCKVDRMSMMNSLEVRVPFLDHKVVEFAATVPVKYKMRGFESKYILKKMMRGLLPSPVLKQRKLGFTIPLNNWFKGRLKGYMGDLLLSDDCALNKLFNPSYIRWLTGEHTAGKQDFGYQIFSMLVLEIWLKEHGHGTLN